ncbi:MAG: hypothetical protein HC824_11290 [Synechococcales cyanobacterium RM1_1_8]|nr:hypothetical protein [Synechococcales cyanobacterium RM1_1_8]
MNPFSSQPPKADPAQVEQLKSWLSELLHIEKEVVISISQLQCHESHCPPIETAITVMTEPSRQFKIHKAVAEIEPADLAQSFQKREDLNDS